MMVYIKKWIKTFTIKKGDSLELDTSDDFKDYSDLHIINLYIGKIRMEM